MIGKSSALHQPKVILAAAGLAQDSVALAPERNDGAGQMNYQQRGLIVSALAAAAIATPAAAGEVTGNGKDIEMHGRSLCAFSGINDTPDGLVLPIGPGGALVVIDPGGQVQSYGYFKSHGGDFLPSPSDPAARDVFAFPGVGCNPVK